MFENTFGTMFAGCDFSRGTETFANNLLQQCLVALNQDEVYEIDDMTLDMLSAAGDATMLGMDDNQ